MADCNFSISFQGPASTIIVKAKTAIETYNGSFSGNETAGEFSVTVFGNSIKGSYTVTGQSLNLNITDKPFFVPCSTIENMLKKEINNS